MALSNDMLLRLSGLATTASAVGQTAKINPALLSQMSTAAQKTTAGPANPFTMGSYENYTNPAKGAVKYGVGFGTGLGGDAATQQLFGKASDLAGLWAMGFDQSDPNFNYKLWEFHQDRMKNDSDYKNYVTKESSKNGWNLNTAQGITFGADWYYRDLARRMGQSHSFLDTTLGKIIGTIGQVAMGAIPVVGPAMSAGLGAYIGQRNGGGFLGGLLGGIGGYSSGNLGSSLVKNGISGTINNAINNVKGFFSGNSSGFVNPNALGTGVGSGASLGLTGGLGTLGSASTQAGLASTLYQPASGALGGLFNTAAGLAGGLYNPGSLATVGGSTGGGLIPTSGSGALYTPTSVNTTPGMTTTGIGASTGGNMGFFDSVLNFLGNNAGDLIQAGVGLYGQSQANQALQNAAQTAAGAAQFRPYNVTTPAGSGAFSGQNAVASLSPQLQQELQRLQATSGQQYNAYQGFNPQNFANNMYGAVKSYKAPEDTFQANDFLDRLYSSGQWGGTPGERALFNFTRGKQAEDNMLRFQAHEAGGAEQDRLFGNYLKSLESQYKLAASPADLLTMGGQFGGAQAQSGANAAMFPWQAAQNSAIGSNNFWSYLAQGAGNLGQSLVNSWGNRNANRSVTYNGPLSPGYQYG